MSVHNYQHAARFSVQQLENKMVFPREPCPETVRHSFKKRQMLSPTPHPHDITRLRSPHVPAALPPSITRPHSDAYGKIAIKRSPCAVAHVQAAVTAANHKQVMIMQV